MIVGKNAWSKSEMKKFIEFMRLAAEMSNGIKKKKLERQCNERQKKGPKVREETEMTNYANACTCSSFFVFTMII